MVCKQCQACKQFQSCDCPGTEVFNESTCKGIKNQKNDGC